MKIGSKTVNILPAVVCAYTYKWLVIYMGTDLFFTYFE